MIKISIKSFRKYLAVAFVAVSVFLAGCAPSIEIPDSEVALYFDENSAVKDNGNKTFNGISATQTVKDMTVGWNLGNTLDATGGSGLSSETSWSQPKTTKAMIDGLANSGIKTIRIPVSWSNHMNKKNYTIDSAWMNRVKTIVDWAIEDGMYVILNDHHDNFGSPAKMTTAAGYYPNKVNKNESERFLLNLWTQIALAFNNGYDEHLIFETLNEPRLAGTNNEWWFDSNNATCREAADCLNEYNQLILDTIRKSGGNNQKRYVSCPGLQASPDSAFASAFKMPQDDEKGKLILSVHMYTPNSFAMESPGETIFTSSHQSNLDYYFSKLNNSFISKGYPVIIGEMGATNKDNLDERVKWFTYFLTESRKYGMTSCLWDNGSWQVQGNNYKEHYGFYNRTNQTWYFPEILDAMVQATGSTPANISTNTEDESPKEDVVILENKSGITNGYSTSFTLDEAFDLTGYKYLKTEIYCPNAENADSRELFVKFFNTNWKSVIAQASTISVSATLYAEIQEPTEGNKEVKVIQYFIQNSADTDTIDGLTFQIKKVTATNTKN